MNMTTSIVRALEQLPPELVELVRDRVVVVTRERPAPDELELGVRPDWRGAFIGWPYDPESGEGRGVLLLYTGNMRRADELEEVLYHELMHFFGADEDDVDEAGFGEHMGLAEREAA
jgi:predicted Zn-dependent protease with MMP-like domain